MYDNKDFYPTPKHLTNQMLAGVDFTHIQSVLEPSAGKGDLVESIIKKWKNTRGYYNRQENFDIDCIEINKDLQHILKGKGYRVVYDDFLTFETYKKYDLIIANPPFSEGDKHLLKMLDMQKSGGQIVCLLNSETIKNTYSNTRRDLANRLEEYNAEIEFIQDAFLNAERKTSVEIALVKVNIPQAKQNSIILNDLKQKERYKAESAYNSNTNLINADFIKGIVEQYNFEVRAGLKLIAEYEALKPLMLNSFDEDGYSNPVLKLELDRKDEDYNCNMANSYIKQMRMKYWKALFSADEFMGKFTSNLRHKYMERVNELRNYDFSLYNIYTIRIDLGKELVKGVEDTILELFDEFTSRYSMETFSKNIHYYNGWKTNKCWKINSKKTIIPLNGFSTWSDDLDVNAWTVKEKLADIEKVFSYLDNGNTEHIDLKQALNTAQDRGQSRKIELKYFIATFYKKGTCHLEWKDEALVHKFNLFASQRKGWLPPSYGKIRYVDMTKEEKYVIDEFEGKNSYGKVIANKDYYITDTSQLLMLA